MQLFSGCIFFIFEGKYGSVLQSLYLYLAKGTILIYVTFINSLCQLSLPFLPVAMYWEIHATIAMLYPRQLYLEILFKFCVSLIDCYTQVKLLAKNNISIHFALFSIF